MPTQERTALMPKHTRPPGWPEGPSWPAHTPWSQVGQENLGPVMGTPAGDPSQDGVEILFQGTVDGMGNGVEGSTEPHSLDGIERLLQGTVDGMEKVDPRGSL